MTRKKIKRSKRVYSKKIVFDRPAFIRIDFLLELYMKIIGDKDVSIDIKIDRVRIELSGEKPHVENTSEKIFQFQRQIERATRIDANGDFQYEQELFKRIFKSQVQSQYLSDALNVLGYSSRFSEDKVLYTQAALNEIIPLQTQCYQAMIHAPQEQNKDIQRFSALLNLISGISHEKILQMAISNNLIEEKDLKYQFKKLRETAFREMLNFLDQKIEDNVDLLSLNEDIEIPEQFGFDGGKIVFINKGKEN